MCKYMNKVEREKKLNKNISIDKHEMTFEL